MKWFSATSLFRHVYHNPDIVTKFEHRVVVVQATDSPAAEHAIQKESREYASAEVGIELLEQGEVVELDEPLGPDVVEVASTVRVSEMEPAQYRYRHWSDLRPQSCDDLGWTHVWYNEDGEHSGCYNCNEFRLGQLWKKKQ